VSETAPSAGAGTLSRPLDPMSGIANIGHAMSDPSSTRPTELEEDLMNKAAPVQEDELLFELDDEPIATVMDESAFAHAAKRFESLPVGERASMAARPAPKKVNPYNIGDGGVNLKKERPEIFTGDFNVSDPESFVGALVKSRYKVVEFLGGDESGLAYLGEDRIGGKKVLVRILLQEESDEMMASILSEERVSQAHLSHPNIARLVDSGTFTNGIQFLVSAYYDGLSVRDILDIYGKFPADRCARIIRQAAGALGHAHQEGILHRDLRPENLIIDTDGQTEQLVLVNFGASNGEATDLNAPYKAPEILDGRIATAASDIFSLAVVAYEMLTGSLPFTGGSTKEIVRAQYAGLSLRPTDIDPELPSAVDGVIERAFSFTAAERVTKARDFGDAFYNALADGTPSPSPKTTQLAGVPKATVSRSETLKPATQDRSAAPAWRQRSPEPPEVEEPGKSTAWILAIVVLLALVVLGWWYIASHPSEPPIAGGGAIPSANDVPVNTIGPSTEMPPLPRTIPQPADTVFFQNQKTGLRGDLLGNFVGFTLYYPKDWKSNGAQPGQTGSRGKFLDISGQTPDGRMVEQMLVSYYPSKGTYSEDAASFPQLVKETNETLKKILPGYQPMSEGEIKVNGEWHGYEVKFQGTGTSPEGDKLTVWGRRIFIPAARLGVRNGFEITMLATSLSPDVKSVDDVGVKGQLGPILYSFEPSQNF